MNRWCRVKGRSDSDILSRIATNLRARRKRAGISVRELCFVSGVPFEVICELEMNALADIDTLTVVALTEALMSDLV